MSIVYDKTIIEKYEKRNVERNFLIPSILITISNSSSPPTPHSPLPIPFSVYISPSVIKTPPLMPSIPNSTKNTHSFNNEVEKASLDRKWYKKRVKKGVSSESEVEKRVSIRLRLLENERNAPSGCLTRNSRKTPSPDVRFKNVIASAGKIVLQLATLMCD